MFIDANHSCELRNIYYRVQQS